MNTIKGGKQGKQPVREQNEQKQKLIEVIQWQDVKQDAGPPAEVETF